MGAGYGGLIAYAHRSEVLARCGDGARVLSASGHDPAAVLGAIVALRGVVHRPFTPTASGHQIGGELAAVIEHLGVLSHHERDAGDAARTTVDNGRRLVAAHNAAASAAAAAHAACVREAARTDDVVVLDARNCEDRADAADGEHVPFFALCGPNVSCLDRNRTAVV